MYFKLDHFKEREIKTSSRQKAFTILGILSITWGFSFLFIKKLTVVFSGIEIGAGRILVAALFLIPFSIKYRTDFPVKKSIPIAVSGLFGYLIPAMAFGIAGSKISSSLSGILNATTPLFVLFVGALFFRSHIYRYQYLGIFLGFAGSLLLIFNGNSTALNWLDPYAALILAATFLYGTNTNIISYNLAEVKPIVISSYSIGLMALPALLILLFTSFFQKIFLLQNLQYLVYFLILGVINSGLAAILYNYLLKITSAVFASTVTYLMPIVAILAGMADGEQVGQRHLIGMAIILLSVLLLNKKVTS